MGIAVLAGRHQGQFVDRAFAISVDALPLNVRPHSVCPPVVGHRGVQVVVYDQDGSFAPALEPWVERGRATYVPFWPRVMSELIIFDCDGVLVDTERMANANMAAIIEYY